MTVKYYVEDTDTYFDSPEDAIEACIDSSWHEDDTYDFKDWVNEKYTAYEVLKDEASLSSLLEEYCEEKNDEDRDEALWDLDGAENGYVVEVHGSSIRVVIEEETIGQSIDVCRAMIEQEKQDALKEQEEQKKDDDVYLCVFQEVK